MRAWLLQLLALTVAAPLSALEGKVVLQDGRPLADATVSILGHPGSSKTDQNGIFNWSPDPALPFEVLVVLPGGQYMAPVLVEALPEKGPLTIVVSPLVTESVTVTSGAVPNIEAPPASGMSIVPQEAIQQRHPVRLTEVLESIPGTGQLSDLHAAVPSIRGLARGRTLILIDGARVTSERRAGASATYLDPFFLEGVEVSRGPGSVAYGSDAFGGVIHARTRHPEPGEPLRLRVHGSLGAGLPEQSAGVEIAGGWDDGGLVFQTRFRNFDPYQSPVGEVFNSAASDRGFLARASQEIGPGRLAVGWQTDFGRDVERPTTRARIIRVSYPKEDSHRMTLSYRMDPFAGFTGFDLEGFVGSYRLVTDRERLPGPGTLRQTTRADVQARDFSFRGLAVRPFGKARLEIGVDVNGRFDLEALGSLLKFDVADELLSTSEEGAIEDAARMDTGVYASTEVLLGRRLTGSGGVRVDRVTTQNQGGFFGDGSTSNSAISGFGSLALELAAGLSLTGQVSRGFRDPTLSDRYFRGVSGRGLVTGNPNLEPETSRQFDVALRYVRGGLRWALHAYHYRIDHLVERFESGEDLFFFRNRGRARLQGVEIEVQGDAGHGLTYEIGAQVARGTTLDDDSPMDDIPVEGVTMQLRKGLGAGGYMELRGALFGRDEEPGPTERVTPGYGTLSLGAGWRVHPRLQFRFLARNLLDKDYPISPDRRAVLAPGRSAVLTFIAEF
ncbi:MAG: TonB-dependent receptor [Acidobacteriota bacterium]